MSEDSSEKPNLPVNKIYDGLVKKLESEMSSSDMKSVKKVYEHLQSKNLKPVSIRNYFTALICTMRKRGASEKTLKPFITLRDKLSAQYEKRMDNGEMTKLQEDNWVTWDIINRIGEELRKEFNETKNPDLIQKIALLEFYKFLPIRNDAYKINVVTKTQFKKIPKEEREKGNYLIRIRKQNIVQIGDYKTAKIYGPQQYELPEHLNNIINAWLGYNKTPYLFINKNGQPFTRNSFTRYFQSIFSKYTDKKVGTRMFRHIYSTEKYGKIRNELLEDARKMGHSLKTQHRIYNKPIVE